MRKKKLMSWRNGVFVLLLSVVMFLIAANSYATPYEGSLTGVDVSYNTFVNGYATQYYFSANELGSNLTAFCIDKTPLRKPYTYAAKVTNSYKGVTALIEEFFYGNRRATQSVYQQAIWSILFPNWNGWGASSEVKSLINGIPSAPTDSFYVAYSSASQDYAVKIPEPSMMMLLGTAMFGLGVVSRRKYLKK